MVGPDTRFPLRVGIGFPPETLVTRHYLPHLLGVLREDFRGEHRLPAAAGGGQDHRLLRHKYLSRIFLFSILEISSAIKKKC